MSSNAQQQQQQQQEPQQQQELPPRRVVTVITYENEAQFEKIKKILAAHPHLASLQEADSHTGFPTVTGKFANVEAAYGLSDDDSESEANRKIAAGVLAPLLTSGMSFTAKAFVDREAAPTQTLSLFALKARLRTSKLGGPGIWTAAYRSAQQDMEERFPDLLPAELHSCPMPKSVLRPLQMSLCQLLQERGVATGSAQKLRYLREHFGDVWPSEVRSVASHPTRDGVAACWGCGKSEGALRKCGGCSVARYCSPECSQHHWRAGHKQECKAHRRGELKTPMCAPIHVAPNLNSCAFCGEIEATLSACSACHSVAYCSKDCQRSHWRAIHKEACGKRVFLAPPAKPAPAAATGAAAAAPAPAPAPASPTKASAFEELD